MVGFKGDEEKGGDPSHDFTAPWLSQTVNADTYALVWESKKLHALAIAVTDFLTEQLAGYVACCHVY